MRNINHPLEQVVQILRDIAKIKKGTDEEVLSEKFLQHFRRNNGVVILTVKRLSGALKMSYKTTN